MDIVKTYLNIRLSQWIYDSEEGEDSGENFDFHDEFDLSFEVKDEESGKKLFDLLQKLTEGREEVID